MRQYTPVIFNFFVSDITFIFGIMKVLITQLCLMLCHPMDCSPPSSSVHGILQARTLEWVAISYSPLLLFSATQAVGCCYGIPTKLIPLCGGHLNLAEINDSLPHIAHVLFIVQFHAVMVHLFYFNLCFTSLVLPESSNNSLC